MAHFAKLDENNVVIDVIKIANEDLESHGGDWSVEAEQWVNNTFKGIYKQTSYNSDGGKYCVYTDIETDESGAVTRRSVEELENDPRCKRWSFAKRGGTYNPEQDVFVGIQPHASWILNTSTWRYDPPIAYPSVLTYGDGSEAYYVVWEEDNLRWLGYDRENNEFAWNPDSSSWLEIGSWVATGN